MSGLTRRQQIVIRNRRRLNLARVRVRQPTAHLRMLPSFLIIGAQRSGTSSLFKYLSGHPRIAPPVRKEIEYFTRHSELPVGWYRSHFPIARGDRISFEATPDYLLDPLAPERARALIPEARIVVLLRDPVERAWSNYRHMRRLGYETLPFGEALQAEPARCASEDHRALYRYSYLERGRYAPQLARWIHRFGRDAIVVVDFADLSTDPDGTVRDLCHHIGLPPWSPSSFRNFSYRSGELPEASQIPAPEAEWLEQQFQPLEQPLEELVGRRLSWFAEKPRTV